MHINLYNQGVSEDMLSVSFILDHKIDCIEDFEKKVNSLLLEPGYPFTDTHSYRLSDPYFYDPYYGYCTCGKILELYNKNTSYIDDLWCDCHLVYIENFNSWNVNGEWFYYLQSPLPDNHFPFGYRQLLYVEPILINDIPSFSVYFFHAMDVKQLSPNVFDVGIGCIYLSLVDKSAGMQIHYAPEAREVLGEENMWKLSTPCALDNNTFFKLRGSHVSWRRKNAYEFVHEHQELLKSKCLNHLVEWQKKGILPRDEYFFHALSMVRNPEGDLSDPFNQTRRFYLNIKDKKL